MRNPFQLPNPELEAEYERQAVLSAIKQWFERRDKPIFRLFGPAGTGKTTLARQVSQEIGGEVAFVAFMGKAAMALRARGCSSATTIHSFIYDVVFREPDNPTFVLKTGKRAPQADLIILDEASTVDADVALDLLSYKIPVLALGDQFQLPSIDGFEYFTRQKPDATLTHVLRQAANSPVLQLATRVRNKLYLKRGAYGDSEIIRLSKITSDHLLRANQILVGTNEMRHIVNSETRKLLGFARTTPEPGDKLICLRSNKKRGLINGSMWSVVDAVHVDDDLISLKLISEDEFNMDEAARARRSVKVPRTCFGPDAEKVNSSRFRPGIDAFGFGYGITVHKAQGSQWDDVLIIDDGRPKEHRERWLYTSLTRAAKRVTVASTTIL